MTDYEQIARILTRNKEFTNPCEDIDELWAEKYKTDWATDKLLLNEMGNIILVFTPEGKYKYTTFD